MSARISASNLAQAAQELMVEWQQTKGYWRDVKALEFEHNYIDVLPDLLTKANAVMSAAEVLIRKVRSDCE